MNFTDTMIFVTPCCKTGRWAPDWSPAAIAARRETLQQLERDWRGIDTTGWSRPAQVDYRLLGSAIARVHWELDIVRGWRRNPMFYLDQTLSVLHDDLLRAPPSGARADGGD